MKKLILASILAVTASPVLANNEEVTTAEYGQLAAIYGHCSDIFEALGQTYAEDYYRNAVAYIYKTALVNGHSAIEMNKAGDDWVKIADTDPKATAKICYEMAKDDGII
ncbi:hypothetical protein AB4177_13485 [Vibrio breoganii]